jgi:3-deoxy-manno-octulosonate cytidylyltransferase (CMP-KDO synthetase)
VKKIAFIPARYGSTRFPGKPLAPIAGVPLVLRVYRQALALPELDQVYVATDDERIAEALDAYHAKVVLTRQPALTGTDRLAEAAALVGVEEGDLIVNIQGDQPMVHPESIRSVIAPFESSQEERDFVMSTLVYPISNPAEIHSTKDVKTVFDSKGYALFFSRAPIPFGRDESQHTYYKHLGVYAYTKQFVDHFSSLPMGELEQLEKLEQLRVLENGLKIKVEITPHDSPEVDFPEDIILLEKNHPHLFS